MWGEASERRILNTLEEEQSLLKKPSGLNTSRDGFSLSQGEFFTFVRNYKWISITGSVKV